MGMKHLHKGKESYPTRVWNIGCGPNGQIISCPPSMGGARNDKTLAHYDPLMQALKLNTRYGHLKFELYVKGGGMEWEYGPYGITDNGYHYWRSCQFPVTVSSDPPLVRWSKRAESVRKVSECQYGSVKKRFRCLKVPFCGSSAANMDNQFRFCCALHNMLLKYDGYDTMGCADDHWIMHDAELDEVRIQRDQQQQVGAHGPSPPPPASVPTLDPKAPNSTTVEYEESYWELRDKLVFHFGVAHSKAEIAWLKPASELRPRAKYQYMAESSAEDTDGEVWGSETEMFD